MPKTKRRFEIEIEAKLEVAAFDEASARKKIAKALAAGQHLSADVKATGALWTYAVTIAEQA
jgi:hypothetical protein